MPDGIDVSQLNLPPGVLFGAIDVEGVPENRAVALLEALERIEQSHAAQKQWALSFERLYDEARRGPYSIAFLFHWARSLLEKQRAASEQIFPLLDEINTRIDQLGESPDPEVYCLYVALFSLTYSWMAPYQALAKRLLDLAAERRLVSQKIMRARPIEGQVNWDKLSNELIAQFPKIRARLAE